MPKYSLTASERETVILLDDTSDVATVSTWQRRVITRLEKNPLATRVEDMRHGTTVGARFEVPAWSVSFRSKRRKASNPTGNVANLRRVGHKAEESRSDAA